MKDILIITHFTIVPGEAGNSRFNYITNKIDYDTSTVEIVTTDFSHLSKAKRDVSEELRAGVNYKLTMLKEPGYTKNVSLKRFYSHYIMGRNLKEYLTQREKPDVIYCAIPSLDVAKVAAKYAEDNDIRFIIDVQDLWPEAFKMAFNVPILSDMMFYPMKRQADYVYGQADEIISVSQTYADRAMKSNNKCTSGNSVYLGTDLDDFDELVRSNSFKGKPRDEIWVAYIGSLAASYDLITVIDGLRILKDQGIENIKFIVMGDGTLKTKFEDYAEEKDIYAEFTGVLSYKDMVGMLTVCDIAVNPIKKGSAGSIINKVGDYAAAGLPVINTQENKEYRNLLDVYGAGINCINGDPIDMADKIRMLVDNGKMRREMGRNNRRLAEERFDRNKTYKDIIDIIHA